MTESFERDASASNLTPAAALLSMRESNDRLSRDRSASMAISISRFEHLRGQHQAMQRSPALLRPVNAMAAPDLKIVTDAWNDFQPAIPLNPPSLIWAAIGAMAAGSSMWLLLGLIFRRRKPPRALAHDNAHSDQDVVSVRQEPSF